MLVLLSLQQAYTKYFVVLLFFSYELHLFFLEMAKLLCHFFRRSTFVFVLFRSPPTCREMETKSNGMHIKSNTAGRLCWPSESIYQCEMVTQCALFAPSSVRRSAIDEGEIHLNHISIGSEKVDVPKCVCVCDQTKKQSE